MYFTKLDDSPMFRKQLQASEESADALKDRCMKFYKGCRKYIEDLGEAYDGDVAFACALESFGGGYDDPLYTALGGSIFMHYDDGTRQSHATLLLQLLDQCPAMTKFAISLREISTYKEILRSQVELLLNDQLIQFANSDLQEIKEIRKRFDKSSGQYDQAREKFLSLKKGTKVEVVSEVEEDLRNARSTFEHARFNLVTCLSNIEAKKKFEFLESVSGTMDAHFRYFKQGYELFLQMEPYIHQVLRYAQHCRQQATYEQAALAERMQDFRQQIERDNQRSLTDIEASPTGDGIHTIGRSSHKMIEALMQSTPCGKVQTIKQGYLLKRSSSLRGDWKRRFFVLDSRGKLYYYHKHWGSSMGSGTQRKSRGRTPEHSGVLSRFLSPHGSPHNDNIVAHHTVNLLTSTIKLDAEQTDLRFCFRIISPSKNYSLQAESALERMEWIDKITGVIASLLNSQISDQPTYSQRLPESPVRSSYRCTGSECSSLTNSCELDPAFWDESRGARAQFDSCHDRPVRGLFTSNESLERPIDLLRCVQGNDVCADCSSSEPDWASLNLGVLLCIECSGVHRNLGVHISKVRSLTLDVKVWEPSVITLFQSLGNHFANSVWEELISEHNERGVLDGCFEVRIHSATKQRKPVSSFLKPYSSDSLTVKEQYIHSKYVEKLFISRPVSDTVPAIVAHKIWNAVQESNVQQVYRLLVSSGADANTTSNQVDAKCISNITKQNNSQTVSSTNSYHNSNHIDINGWTLLHLACHNGDICMVELLMQYGAQVNAVDQWGQTPLHQCSIHRRIACVKLLLSRGAITTIVDKLGKTALQAAMEQQDNIDDELLTLLS